MVRLDVGTAWDCKLQNNMGNNTNLGLEPRSCTSPANALANRAKLLICRLNEPRII